MGSETDSVVERVARAVWERANPENPWANALDDDYYDGPGRNTMRLMARAAIEPVIDHAVAIMEARLPLYTDIAARNAIRECISSIKASALDKALEE